MRHQHKGPQLGQESAAIVRIGKAYLKAGNRIHREAKGSHPAEIARELLFGPLVKLIDELNVAISSLCDDLQPLLEASTCLQGPKHDGEAIEDRRLFGLSRDLRQRLQFC